MTTPSERERLADRLKEAWVADTTGDCWFTLADIALRLAADAVREEREACAVVVEADPPDKNAMTPGDLAVYRVHAKNIARRIRARTPASGEEGKSHKFLVSPHQSGAALDHQTCAACQQPYSEHPKAPRP